MIDKVYERAPLSNLPSEENTAGSPGEADSATKEPEKEKPVEVDAECEFFRVGDLGKLTETKISIKFK